MNIGGSVYDNDQVVHLIRRLPLAEGYKVTIPVFATLGGAVIEIPMEVTQRKTIEVPAGKYECYGLHMGGAINQMYWFSTDSRHYLVKFEASSVIGELTAIRQKNGLTPNEYRDDEFGFTLAAPAGWFFQRLRSGMSTTKGTCTSSTRTRLPPRCCGRQSSIPASWRTTATYDAAPRRRSRTARSRSQTTQSVRTVGLPGR